MPDFQLEVDEELAGEVRRLATKLRITPEEFAAQAIRMYLADQAGHTSERSNDGRADERPIEPGSTGEVAALSGS